MPLRHAQIAPGVYRMYTRYTNWYVLEEGGRLTVLDSGLPADWRQFLGTLTRLGYTPTHIESVVITHHHPDHAGNAERMRSHGARILAHPADHPYLRGERRTPRGGRAKFLWHPWYAVYMLHLLTRGVTRVPPVGQVCEMTDGEMLDVPGSPRVIHTPGNTNGHCALFVEDRGILFSGDALVTLDCTRGRTGPTIIRGPDTADVEAAWQSLSALAATDAPTVLPGHGEPWLHGVQSAVDIARQQA